MRIEMLCRMLKAALSIPRSASVGLCPRVGLLRRRAARGFHVAYPPHLHRAPICSSNHSVEGVGWSDMPMDAGNNGNLTPPLEQHKGDATPAGEQQNAPRRVLLTNDDGADSEFFIAWTAYVQEKLGWNCLICPPADGQSFVSKSISRGPIKVINVRENVYHISGSPATCVNIGLYQLGSDCDFVISGPNVGHNVGRGSVLSSGTIGAALEGSISGRKSLAISFPFFTGFGNWTPEDLEIALEAAGKVVKDLWENWPDDHGILYNINVPLDYRDEDGKRKDDPSTLYTNVDSNSQYTSLYRRRDGEVDMYDWGPVGLRVFQAPDNDPDGDVAAIKAGNISVSALRAGFLPHG